MQAETDLQTIATKSTPESWLSKLNSLFAPHPSMTALLQKASELVVGLLDVEDSVITWMTEEQAALEVRASFRNNGQKGVFVDTNQTDWSVMEADSANGNSQLRVHHPTKDKLAMPLYIRDEVVGYLCVTKGRQQHDFEHSSIDANQFILLSQYIGHAIEMQQIRQLLASRYTAAAWSRSEQEASADQDGMFTRLVDSVKYPNKVAKIIAKSFYKDLRKAGFEPKQILVVASEIIENLNETFRKTKAKTEEQDS